MKASLPELAPALTTAHGRLCIVLAALLWSTSGAFTKLLTQPTGFGLDQPAVAREILVVRDAEPLELGRFLPVGAHDAHTGQRLLRDGAHLGQLRLNLLEPFMDRGAEQLHRHRHER